MDVQARAPRPGAGRDPETEGRGRAMKRNRTDRLIVFTRFPEPGRTKTRLIAALGARGASDLQRRMTGHTLNRVRAFREKAPVEVEVRYEGASRERIREWLGRDLRLSPQGGGDLGLRMDRAFQEAFRSGAKRVALIGTDCPGLGLDQLKEAFRALREREVVLGPARDGGYYLVGLRRPRPELFRGIAWGTGEVLARTREIAAGRGLCAALLAPLEDVDRPEDLGVWESEQRRVPFPGGPFRVSVIVPSLDEARTVEGALESIRGAPDVAERIVVDGGSRDGTPARAEALGARVLSAPPGRAAQMNAGARAARGSVLLFLHADSRLPFGFEHHVQRILSDPATVGGAFLHAIERPGPAYRGIERLANLRSLLLRMPYGDQGIFLRARCFREAGGFPEQPIMEDFEFMRRLRRMGRVEIAPTAVISSARRYDDIGVARATWRNQMMILGALLRVRPARLAAWYRAGSARRGPS